MWCWERCLSGLEAGGRPSGDSEGSKRGRRAVLQKNTRLVVGGTRALSFDWGLGGGRAAQRQPPPGSPSRPSREGAGRRGAWQGACSLRPGPGPRPRALLPPQPREPALCGGGAAAAASRSLTPPRRPPGQPSGPGPCACRWRQTGGGPASWPSPGGRAAGCPVQGEGAREAGSEGGERRRVGTGQGERGAGLGRPARCSCSRPRARSLARASERRSGRAALLHTVEARTGARVEARVEALTAHAALTLLYISWKSTEAPM